MHGGCAIILAAPIRQHVITTITLHAMMVHADIPMAVQTPVLVTSIQLLHAGMVHVPILVVLILLPATIAGGQVAMMVHADITAA
jgi:hypothetical protein